MLVNRLAALIIVQLQLHRQRHYTPASAAEAAAAADLRSSMISSAFARKKSKSKESPSKLTPSYEDSKTARSSASPFRASDSNAFVLSKFSNANQMRINQ